MTDRLIRCTTALAVLMVASVAAVISYQACVPGARQGYSSVRAELGAGLSSEEVDEVLAAYRVEGAKLVTMARAVELVERASRGEVVAVNF